MTIPWRRWDENGFAVKGVKIQPFVNTDEFSQPVMLICSHVMPMSRIQIHTMVEKR